MFKTLGGTKQDCCYISWGKHAVSEGGRFSWKNSCVDKMAMINSTHNLHFDTQIIRQNLQLLC